MFLPTTTSHHFTTEFARQRQLLPEEISALVFSHGSMKLRYYAPQEEDRQIPHAQDELYIVISGSGFFEQNGKEHSFQPHDVIFVPAGVDHRFMNFTDNFATWVIFYGSPGGELKLS